MKKITSVAALCLRLTWVRVLGLFALVGGAQWFGYLVLEKADFEWSSFEYLLDRFPAWIGKGGFLFLAMILLFTAAGGKGSKIEYTLRRLRVTEDTTTLIFSLVFAGYIVSYWTFQLCMVLLFYGYYDSFHGYGHELLFLSAFRSEYFHFLLPLYEPWALVRNVVVVLTLSIEAALEAYVYRNGRGIPVRMLVVNFFIVNLMYPDDVASMGRDIVLIVISVACAALDWYFTRRWIQDEAD